MRGVATVLGVAAAVVGTGSLRPAEATAPAPRYRMVQLGVLGLDAAGGSYSSGSAINAAGEVVGYSSTLTTPGGHGFSWRDGRLRDLPDGLGGAGASGASAVNDAGVVAGAANVISQYEHPHAVLWRDGQLVDLGTGYGKGSGSSASGINNAGQVVGQHYRTVRAPTRAVLWSGGRIRDLGTLGGSDDSPYGTESEAHAINDRGQIVGAALPKSGVPLHGFLWEKGVMRDLGTLGGNGEATVAIALNEQPAVTGQSQTASGETHAFLWRGGRMRDLGALGPAFPGRTSVGYGINEAGVVVGLSRIPGGAYGTRVGFVWRDGTMYDLNRLVRLPLGRRIEYASAISDSGSIVALTCVVEHCETDGSTDRAVLLVPA